MARVATDQSTVLQAVRDRIIAELDEFTTKNCFVTAEPPAEPPANIRDNLFCTISPTDGQSDLGAHEGGGENTTFEYAGAMIVVFTAIKLDRVGHDQKLLMDIKRGLLVVKHAITKALSGHDLVNDTGDQILINLIAPIRAEKPQSAGDKSVGDLSLLFSTDFEWDLT